MKTMSSDFKIETITFDSEDTKVLVKGELIKNHLSYSSEFFISFNELNLLLNYLQHLNPEIYISNLLKEEQFGNYYSQTYLDVENIDNKVVDLSIFSFNSNKKLIRA
jgi:hypothetical protein